MANTLLLVVGASCLVTTDHGISYQMHTSYYILLYMHNSTRVDEVRKS